MSIENNNNQEQKEVVKQENINENNTTESILQEKFKDPIKESFFTDILNDPQIKNTYTTESIKKFIQGDEKISKFYRANKKIEHDEKVKKIIEMIDVFEKNNGNTTIINVSNILKDDVDNKKDDVDNKKDDVDNKKDDVDNKKDDVDNKKDDVDNKKDDVDNKKDDVDNKKDDVDNKKDDVDNKKDDVDNKKKIQLEGEKIKESRRTTKESYDKLNKANYPEPTSEEINTGKGKISKETQQKLEQNGLNLDEYAKFLVFEQKYEKTLRKNDETEFLTNFKQLREDLGDQTNLEEMSNPNNADKIASELNYSDNSPTLNKLSTPNLPETKDFDEEFDMYIKFIDDEKERQEFTEKKDDLKKYKEIYDKTPEEAIKIQEGTLNEIYDRYESAIKSIKEELPTQTKEFAKQRVLGTCITGLAKYFDSSTSIVNKSNFDKDFAIDTQDGFSIDKGDASENEDGDDILHMKGNINGSEVGFYYNLTDPEASLQSDDFLSFDEVSQSFVFKEGAGGKTNLGVKLPTIDFLTDKAQNILDSNFAETLEKAEDGKSFEAAIKEKISEELLKYYGQEAIVETRIERDIEKNITVQTLQNTFFPDAVLTEFNKEGKNINDTNDKKARKLLEIRDESTENMRSDELKKFRGLITRLDPLTKKSHDNLEPRRQKILEEIDNDRGAETYNNERGEKTLNFFNKFSKDGQIDLENLEVFITSLEKRESIAENMSQYSADFQTAEESDLATDELQLNNDDLRNTTA